VLQLTTMFLNTNVSETAVIPVYGKYHKRTKTLNRLITLTLIIIIN